MSEIKLSPMTKDQAAQAWPLVKGHLEKAIKYGAGRTTIEDIEGLVKRGTMMLMLIWEPEDRVIHAVIGCEAYAYPRQTVMGITICGGAGVEEWGKRLWPAVVEIARMRGFTQVEVSGRAGWKKYLEGAREIGRTFVIDIPQDEPAVVCDADKIREEESPDE